MNSKFLLIVLSFAGFSSCTTAYKTGQTPDDVYYSPAQPETDYRTDHDRDRNVYNEPSGYQENNTRVNNRQWRRYHDYDYGYTTYDPCYAGYVDPKIIQSKKYIAPRKVNIGGYRKNTDNSGQVKISKTSGTGMGNFLRDIFNGSNSSSSANNKGSSNQTNTNSGSNSSGSKSSGTTNVPVRTFGHK